MRKTKIICTLGPTTMDRAVLKQLCLGGMNVARLNFSHGDHDIHLEQLHMLQELREELDLPIAAMCDTKGPEIRTGLFDGGSAQLQAGDTFTLYGQERLMDPSDIANSIVFLVSQQAHGVNGIILFCDGGTDALLNTEKVY